jgi:hypothetical protein
MGAEKRWLFTLFSSALLSLLFLLVYSISAFSSSKQFPSIIHHGIHYPPAFAYYISGGRGDKDRILRLLLAVYHPRNRYLLHLGAEASDEERMKLVGAVNAVPAIRSFGNVDVVGKPGRLTYMGSSNLAAILRAAAILLRMDAGWTWFVSLSAMDYPLVTQDGMLFFFLLILIVGFVPFWIFLVEYGTVTRCWKNNYYFFVHLEFIHASI